MIHSPPREPKYFRMVCIALLVGSFALSSTFHYVFFMEVTPLFSRFAPRPQIINGEPTSPPTLPDLAMGTIRNTAYHVIAWATSEEFLRFFLMLSLTIVFLNELSYIPLAWLHRYVSEKFRSGPLTKHLPISVVIPAHNEERTVGYVIETLLEADYSNKQVIVVNDGSADHTMGEVMPYAFRGKVQLINRPNGGKAAALNTGLLVANGDIVVVMDADGAIERNALKWIASQFEDPNVIAVSGNPKVGNRDTNILTRVQALDYVRGINLRRRAFDLLNILECIPGSIGAFRTTAYREVGRYDIDTLAEDMDVTLKFVKTRGTVRQESRAIVYTEAPETLRDFIRQRLRWYGGGIQAVYKHGDHWWRFGALSFIGFPYLVAGMTIAPVFELLLVALSIIQILAGMWLVQVLYWSSVAAIDVAFSIIAVLLEKEDWRLILYSPIYALVYRHLNNLIKLKSYWDLVRGRLNWQTTRAERQGGLALKIKI